MSENDFYDCHKVEFYSRSYFIDKNPHNYLLFQMKLMKKLRSM